MDVNDEEVSDEDGCMSRSMTIKAHRRIMTERIMDQPCGQRGFVFQPSYSDTGAPLREERVIPVRKKSNLHLEFYQRGVTDGLRTQIVSRDSQHVTLHVLLTPETKDPINEESAHEDAERCHADQRGVSGGLHEAEMLEVLSARTDFCYISEVLHRNAETAESSRFACTEKLSVTLSCPHQTRSLLKWMKTLPR